VSKSNAVEKSARARVFDRFFLLPVHGGKPETMMFGLHETMQSRMHSGLKEEPSLLPPGAGAGAMQHLMHHHHHHHHVASVRNWMQPTVVDQAAALARYISPISHCAQAGDSLMLFGSRTFPVCSYQLTYGLRIKLNKNKIKQKFLNKYQSSENLLCSLLSMSNVNVKSVNLYSAFS